MGSATVPGDVNRKSTETDPQAIVRSMYNGDTFIF